MAVSKNNIENRGVTQIKECPTCKKAIKHTRVIKRGKGRMIPVCGCGFNILNASAISHLL